MTLLTSSLDNQTIWYARQILEPGKKYAPRWLFKEGRVSTKTGNPPRSSMQVCEYASMQTAQDTRWRVQQRCATQHTERQHNTKNTPHTAPDKTEEIGNTYQVKTVSSLRWKRVACHILITFYHIWVHIKKTSLLITSNEEDLFQNRE